MTWIVDGSGRRWVDPIQRKRRRSPRALRFADLQAGAILTHRGVTTISHFEQRDRFQHRNANHPFANDDAKEIVEKTPWVLLVLVTDRWFDPVAGQDDRVAGEMAATRPIGNYGLASRKTSHTLRGLASQGYDWTTPEQAALAKRWVVDREVLMTEWKAGALTDDEARMRAVPFRTLLRQMGIEA